MITKVGDSEREEQWPIVFLSFYSSTTRERYGQICLSSQKVAKIARRRLFLYCTTKCAFILRVTKTHTHSPSNNIMLRLRQCLTFVYSDSFAGSSSKCSNMCLMMRTQQLNNTTDLSFSCIVCVVVLTSIFVLYRQRKRSRHNI